jgi:cytoskeletal protein CcmA (bactofilin family)
VNTEISGKIDHPGRVTVAGRFDGEINVQDTLTVEKNGVVCAKVSAGKVVCNGEIHGDVQAKSMVRITSNGRIHGAIHTPSIEIEEGANFEGQCHTQHKPDEPAPPHRPRWQWKKISTYRWAPV